MTKQDLVNYWQQNKIVTNQKVINAFLAIPREEFVSPQDRENAYLDVALSIGYGATISQPTTVMIMTQALEVEEGNKILEVGTGSGYQAAILSNLVGEQGKIYSVEIVPELVDFAQKNLKRVGIKNVEVFLSDGSIGLEKFSPYDRIIVTAAAPEIPLPLLDQLKINGIMIIPLGERTVQKMIKITKKEKELIKEDLGAFVFVPLKGKYGHK